MQCNSSTLWRLGGHHHHDSRAEGLVIDNPLGHPLAQYRRIHSSGRGGGRRRARCGHHGLCGGHASGRRHKRALRRRCCSLAGLLRPALYVAPVLHKPAARTIPRLAARSVLALTHILLLQRMGSPSPAPSSSPSCSAHTPTGSNTPKPSGWACTVRSNAPEVQRQEGADAALLEVQRKLVRRLAAGGAAALHGGPALARQVVAPAPGSRVVEASTRAQPTLSGCTARAGGPRAHPKTGWLNLSPRR